MYIQMSDESKFYDVVLFEVDFDSFEINDIDMVNFKSRAEIKRFSFESLEDMVDKAASLIRANEFTW